MTTEMKEIKELYAWKKPATKRTELTIIAIRQATLEETRQAAQIATAKLIAMGCTVIEKDGAYMVFHPSVPEAERQRILNGGMN